MESWRKLAAQCEELLLRYQSAKSEGERKVLLTMAARKFDQAAALRRLTK